MKICKKTKLDTIIRYSPESNSIAKQYNCSILKKVNILQFEAELGAEYWDKTCQIVIYFWNRDPILGCALSPYKTWTENKPIVIYCYICDCLVYIYIVREKHAKLYYCS